MNQEVPTGDIIFGSIVLVILLVCAYVAGRWLSAMKNARFSKAWAPLVPLIDGTVAGDGGGAATSWLSGMYQGKQVQASMIPGRNKISGDSGPRYNYFDVALMEIPGTQDWRIEHKTALLGLGNTGWQIASEDQALTARLQAAQITDRLTQLGNPTITYKQRERALRLSADVTPRWVPTPERFLEELELLLLLTIVVEAAHTDAI